MEQKLKQFLGDCIFSIATLQAQVETLQLELNELKKQNEDKPKRT